MRQSFEMYQKMRNKIPHLLILNPMDAAGSLKVMAGKLPKIDFTGVEIAWVDVKKAIQKSYAGFLSRNST